VNFSGVIFENFDMERKVSYYSKYSEEESKFDEGRHKQKRYPEELKINYQ